MERAIPAATVTLTNLGTNESRTAQSDSGGNFTFVNLLPGNYGITAEKTGFKKLVRNPIEIQVNSAVRVDAAMEVGDSMQTVQVTAEVPLVQTQNATIGTEVEARQVADLALNGRNVLNLIELAPGVVPQGNTLNGGNAVTAGLTMLNYQMGGGQADQSAAYVDGAPVNVSYENGAGWVPVQDAVQEFRIVTNDVGPEFGRFAGGVVNISTKSGTNTIHGTAYDYLRNQDLNANTFFNNKAGLPRAIYQQNEYGAAIGGPDKKEQNVLFRELGADRLAASFHHVHHRADSRHAHGRFLAGENSVHLRPAHYGRKREQGLRSARLFPATSFRPIARTPRPW